MTKIEIVKATGNDVFADLRADWERLFSESASSPFSSWEWQSVWQKYFGANKTPTILKAFRGAELIGILPLFVEEKRIFGMKHSRIGLIGEKQGGADYLDLIANESDAPDISSAIADFLNREKGFQQISFEYVNGNSSVAAILKCMAATDSKPAVRYSKTKKSICPQIRLELDSAAVLKQSRRYSNYKRRLKTLEKMVGFKFRSVTSASETVEAFERFYRLHERRWAESGGSELSGHPRLVAFQRELVSQLASSGLLRFDELWVEGECRASIYALDNGRVFYYYNAGYDLNWSKLSVGLVLIGLSVKNAAERGNLTYDFLRGDEVYKYDWSNQTTDLLNITVSRPGFVTSIDNAFNLTSSNLSGFSNSILPMSLAEKMKSLRRRLKRNYQLENLESESPLRSYE